MAKSFGLYVTLVRNNEIGWQTKSEEITYKNRAVISVHEILSYFDALDLKPNEKVWIKKYGFDDFRAAPFGMASQLLWLDFHKCIIVLAPDIVSARKMLSPHQTIQAESRSNDYEQNLAEQVKIWKEKRERHGPSRSVQMRNQAKITVIRRQRKKRLAQQKKDPDT